MRKADEPIRVERLGSRNPGLSFGTEIGALLEVLERLPHLWRPREEGVVDMDGHLLHLDVVALRVQRADEVVPRVHAAAHGEVAPVAKFVAGGEGRGDGT